MGFFGFIKSLFGGIFDFGKQIVNFIKNAIVGMFKKKMQENMVVQAEQAMNGSRRTINTQPVYGYGYTSIPTSTPVAQSVPVQRPVVQPQAPVEDELKWNDGMSTPKPPVYTVPSQTYMNTMSGAYQYTTPMMSSPIPSNQSYGKPITPNSTYQYNSQDELRWHDNPNRQTTSCTNPWENMTVNGSVNELFDIKKPAQKDQINKPSITSGFTTMASMTNNNTDDGIVRAFAPKTSYVGNTQG